MARERQQEETEETEEVVRGPGLHNVRVRSRWGQKLLEILGGGLDAVVGQHGMVFNPCHAVLVIFFMFI